MEFYIDRKSAISVRQQIKGTIEYSIAFGSLSVGSQLPSIRDLAEQIGVAPMTISHVYRELKLEGLIETRNGDGTYVADSSQARMASAPNIEALHHSIDALIDEANTIGINGGDLTTLVTARISHRRDIGRQAFIVMAGLFPDATASYARFVEQQIGAAAHVEGMTIDSIRRDPAIFKRACGADLVLCFSNMHGELSELLPGVKVVSIRFIPSEETRLALASLNPMSTVLAVSRFSAFVPILKSGVQRFAAHVDDVTAVNIDDDKLAAQVATCSVLVYSTGAEVMAEYARPGLQLIEYRHTPDPGDIRRLVLPFLVQSTPSHLRLKYAVGRRL